MKKKLRLISARDRAPAASLGAAPLVHTQARARFGEPARILERRAPGELLLQWIPALTVAVVVLMFTL